MLKRSRPIFSVLLIPCLLADPGACVSFAPKSDLTSSTSVNLFACQAVMPRGPNFWNPLNLFASVREVQLLRAARPVNSRHLGVARGSALAVFNLLLRRREPFSLEEICNVLEVKAVTLQPDISALTTHLGLVEVTGGGTDRRYGLLDAVRDKRNVIIPVLQELYNLHGTRPVVPVIEARRQHVDELLGRPTQPAQLVLAEADRSRENIHFVYPAHVDAEDLEDFKPTLDGIFDQAAHRGSEVHVLAEGWGVVPARVGIEGPMIILDLLSKNSPLSEDERESAMYQVLSPMMTLTLTLLGGAEEEAIQIAKSLQDPALDHFYQHFFQAVTRNRKTAGIREADQHPELFTGAERAYFREKMAQHPNLRVHYEVVPPAALKEHLALSLPPVGEADPLALTVAQMTKFLGLRRSQLIAHIADLKRLDPNCTIVVIRGSLHIHDHENLVEQGYRVWVHSYPDDVFAGAATSPEAVFRTGMANQLDHFLQPLISNRATRLHFISGLVRADRVPLSELENLLVFNGQLKAQYGDEEIGKACRRLQGWLLANFPLTNEEKFILESSHWDKKTPVVSRLEIPAAQNESIPKEPLLDVRAKPDLPSKFQHDRNLPGFRAVAEELWNRGVQEEDIEALRVDLLRIGVGKIGKRRHFRKALDEALNTFYEVECKGQVGFVLKLVPEKLDASAYVSFEDKTAQAHLLHAYKPKSYRRKGYVHAMDLAIAAPHENVQRIAGFGTTEKLAWWVQEWVEGEPLLETLVHSDSLPIPEIRAVLRGLRAGLQHLLEHGLVNWDLKLSDVVLQRDSAGRVAEAKLIDMGELSRYPEYQWRRFLAASDVCLKTILGSEAVTKEDWQRLFPRKTAANVLEDTRDFTEEYVKAMSARYGAGLFRAKRAIWEKQVYKIVWRISVRSIDGQAERAGQPFYRSFSELFDDIDTLLALLERKPGKSADNSSPTGGSDSGRSTSTKSPRTRSTNRQVLAAA